MARNGSGVYSLPAGNPVTTGTIISSTWANTTLSDIASALTTSISSDGQTVPTANLPMATYAHTNVGNATVRTMYAAAAQVEDGSLNYLTSITGSDAITAVAPVGMTAYAAGQVFRFISAGANTGPVTLNLNSIGAKSLVRTDGSALVAGDIASGAAVQVFYDGTNFQLLSDSNGKSETFTSITTGSLTDSGLTSGRVTFAGTGGLLSDSANLIWDNTNGYLGIGISSPTTKLHVVSPVLQGLFEGSSQGSIAIQKAGTTGIGLYSGATDTLGFYANGAGVTRLFIDSSGNLGLGVTPSGWSAYRVVQLSGISGIYANNSNEYGTFQNAYYNSGWKYGTTGIGSTWMTQYQGTYTWNIAPSGTAGNPITFTQAMTLDASGNLGIGTTSPATTFQTNGAIANVGSTSSSAFSGTASVVNASVSAAAPGTHGSSLIFAQSWSSGSPSSVIATGQITGVKLAPDGTFGGGLAFWTSNGAGTDLAERMRLDSSGNLGLGVTPSGWQAGWKAFELGNAGNAIVNDSAISLRLLSNARFAGSSWLYTSTNVAARYDMNGGAHAWYTAPSGTAGTAITFTQAMTLDASGNLAIGATTSAASTRLTISGNADIFRSVHDTAYYSFYNSANTVRTGFIQFNATTASTISVDIAQPLTFNTSAVERMRIDSGGNTYIESGNLWQYAPTPTSISAVTTLTAAQLQTDIINTTGTTYTVTLPTGTAIDAGFTGVPTTNIAFDFHIVNSATGTITMAVNTGVTSLGTLTVATGVSAHFRLRRTAANTYVLYRLS